MDNNDLDSDIIHPEQILYIDGESGESSDSGDNNNAQEEQSSDNEEAEATEEENNEEAEAPAPKEDNNADQEATEESNEEESDNPEGETVSAEATAYTASCEGCSGTTATGVDLDANPDEKVIAVDPDVIPLGSKVHVEGYGTATAAD